MFALNNPNWQGGHGKIRKVQIENFDHAPSYIEFASKKLKPKDNYDAHANFLWKHWFVSLIIWVSYNFMSFMQKPCKHTNCGGMEAHLGKC